MEQLTKKINMIDVLGMILPGGLLLLLFEQDLHFLEYVRQYLDVSSDKLIWGMVFLSGSYLFGMLVHEIGSIPEKLMWRSLLINPRIYAALNTGLVDPQKIDLKKLANKVCEDKNQKSEKKGGDRQACKIIIVIKRIIKFLAILFKWIMKAIVGLIKFMGKLLMILPALCIVYFAVGMPSIDRMMFVVIVSLVVAALLQYDTTKKLLRLILDHNSLEKMKSIVQDDCIYFKESHISAENDRKRELFNGYYSLARSVLAVLAIVQLYVWLSSGGNSSLVTLHDEIYKNQAFLSLQVLIVAGLVLRYWHYSCLRFTYCYRGYIHNSTNPKK